MTGLINRINESHHWMRTVIGHCVVTRLNHESAHPSPNDWCSSYLLTLSNWCTVQHGWRLFVYGSNWFEHKIITDKKREEEPRDARQQNSEWMCESGKMESIRIDEPLLCYASKLIWCSSWQDMHFTDWLTDWLHTAFASHKGLKWWCTDTGNQNETVRHFELALY